MFDHIITAKTNQKYAHFIMAKKRNYKKKSRVVYMFLFKINFVQTEISGCVFWEKVFLFTFEPTKKFLSIFFL